MSDTRHICFTVGATRYLANLDREDLRGEHIAVHYQKAPVTNEDGSTSISLIMPVLITTLYLAERQDVADKVAALLNKHWDDDEKPEPSCAGCGQPASEHLGKGDCEQFISCAEDLAAALIVLARDYDFPPDMQEILLHGAPLHGIKPGALAGVLAPLHKELADLRAQGERQSSTIAIHHQNFDEIYERACRETGEFAEWVRSITHPEAEQR